MGCAFQSNPNNSLYLLVISLESLNSRPSMEAPFGCLSSLLPHGRLFMAVIYSTIHPQSPSIHWVDSTSGIAIPGIERALKLLPIRLRPIGEILWWVVLTLRTSNIQIPSHNLLLVEPSGFAECSLNTVESTEILKIKINTHQNLFGLKTF